MTPTPTRLVHPAALMPGYGTGPSAVSEPPAYEMGHVGGASGSNGGGGGGYDRPAVVTSRPEKSSYYQGGR